MQGKTVLVVDDAESICLAIQSLLERTGCVVLTASDGADGVRQARQSHPDVILLDIMMPVMDGWGALRELRASPETSDIPVLALSALRISEDKLGAAGFDGYLSKPVPPHRLVDEVRRACEAVR